MTLRLRPDGVLVKLAPPVDRTASGLLTPHAMPAAVSMGKVVQVGERVSDVTPGDIVAFSPASGDPLEGYFPTPHLVIAEQHIAAVLESV